MVQEVVRQRMSEADWPRPAGCAHDTRFRPPAWRRRRSGHVAGLPEDLAAPHPVTGTCPQPQVRDLLVDRVRYLGSATTWSAGAAARKRSSGGRHAGQGETRAEQLLRQQLYRLPFNLANILRDLGRYGRPARWTRRSCAGRGAAWGRVIRTPCRPQQPCRRPAGPWRLPGGPRVRPGNLPVLGGEQRLRRRLPRHAQRGEQPRPVLLLTGDYRMRSGMTSRPWSGGWRVWRSHPRSLTRIRGRARPAGSGPLPGSAAHESSCCSPRGLGDDARITLNADCGSASRSAAPASPRRRRPTSTKRWTG